MTESDDNLVLGVPHIHPRLGVDDGSEAAVVVTLLQLLQQLCMCGVRLPAHCTHLYRVIQ